MKPSLRQGLSWVPLILQFLAMTSALALISFLSPTVASLVKEHDGKSVVPRPAVLLANYPVTAKMIVVGLFAVSFACFFISRSRMKDEVDQLAIQGAVFGIVWWLGIFYSSAVIMAGVVAYIAVNQR